MSSRSGGKRTVARGRGSNKVEHAAPKVRPEMKLLKMTPESFKEARAIYDPDNDPEIKPATVKSDTLYERAHIQRKHKDGDTSISGTIAVPRGGEMREVGFGDWSELARIRGSREYMGQKFRESHGVTIRGPKRLKEAYPDAFGLGDSPAGADVGVNDEFHPLTLGPFNRNMYLYDFLDQASKAFEGYHHNPILKAGVNTLVNFVMGDGLKVVAASPMCQAKWDEFEQRVKLRTGTSYSDKMRMMFRDASVIGETYVTDPVIGDGPVMKLWDATTVWEVVTNPRDIEDVYYAYRQFPTQWQLPVGEKGGQVPQLSEYVVEQIPADKWLHVKVNATIGEKRGRSDLFSVLGWGKRFKDWFDAAVVNGQISNAFVLWWKVEGSAGDVDALRNNSDFTRVPPPGSAWFTNQAVTPNLLRPQGGVNTGDKTGEQLLSIIAVSMNLPPEYFGVAGAATRATALVRGEPAQRFFAQRQELVRDVTRWQFRRVMLRAQERGELPSHQPKQAGLRDIISALRAGDWDRAARMTKRVRGKDEYEEKLDLGCEVILPNLVTEDRTTKLRDMATAHTTGVISKETYATQAAKALDISNYDFDDEQRKMADERERGIQVSALPPSLSGGAAAKFGSPDSNTDYRRGNKDKPAA